MRISLVAAAVLAAACAAASPQRSADSKDGGRPAPLVIGHRGAPGYLPDHTLEGYALEGGAVSPALGRSVFHVAAPVE